jgi:hypothetical protein
VWSGCIPFDLAGRQYGFRHKGVSGTTAFADFKTEVEQ